MHRLISILFVLLFLPTSALGEGSSVKFIYSDLAFYIPAEASIIGTKGGDENFTFFRYSTNKGKDFLAFSDMSKDNSSHYGCDPQTFFGLLAGEPHPNDCNKSEVESFRQHFVGNSDKGRWNSAEFTVYYFVSAGQSFLFVFKDDKTIKIDSDFLDKKELRDIVKHYLD